MRYLVPSSAAARRPVGPRAAARLLASVTAAVWLTGCSWITGVPNVDRVSVVVSPPTISAGGQAAAVIGEALRDDGSVITHTRRIVSFRSTNPTVATVSGSGSGVVTGVTAGTAWIVGESGGKRDSAQVTVTPPLAPGIQIDPSFPRVRVGGTASVAVRPIGTNGQPLTGFTLACQSSTPAVLNATASGTNCALNGLAVGTAVLRVTVNGVSGADFNVIVENEAPARVVPVIRSPVRETERVAVGVELRRADDTIIPTTGRTFTYSSSDNSVLTVDPSGVLSAVREGQATVTVTADNVTGTAVVRVTKIPVVDLLLPQSLFFRVGAQNGIRIAPIDSLNRELPTAGRLLRYTAGDPTVLTISAAGLIQPLKEGTTTITVTVDSITRTTSATVTAMPVGIVDIDSNFVERNPGGTFQYTATVLDSLGRRLTDRRIIWQSQNSAVVSINASTGLARAETPGQVAIQAIVERVPGFPGNVVDQGSFTVFAAPVARVEVAPSSVTVRVGGTTLVSLLARDAAGNQLFGRNIQATSTNPGVAVADGTGAVRGLSAGTTTIRFQAVDNGGQPQGEAAELSVTVSATAAARRPAP
ncbi:MAG: Ig-like domain-containing protein [Gemmatirosa sp.]